MSDAFTFMISASGRLCCLVVYLVIASLSNGTACDSLASFYQHQPIAKVISQGVAVCWWQVNN